MPMQKYEMWLNPPGVSGRSLDGIAASTADGRREPRNGSQRTLSGELVASILDDVGKC